jgi:hypothetical protein
MKINVIHNDINLAIIIKNSYSEEGVSFFTSDELSQQLAYMKHSSGKKIIPHVHNTVVRNIHTTQEVLILKKGKLRIDFYTNDKKYIESHIIEAGDVILLIEGGHGFHVLEDIEMIEVKQGPYVGNEDKTRFEAVSDSHINVVEDYSFE